MAHILAKGGAPPLINTLIAHVSDFHSLYLELTAKNALPLPLCFFSFPLTEQTNTADVREDASMENDQRKTYNHTSFVISQSLQIACSNKNLEIISEQKQQCLESVGSFMKTWPWLGFILKTDVRADVASRLSFIISDLDFQRKYL